MAGNSCSADTIYVVDDDPAVRDALSVVFSLEGFNVVAFESADSFLDAAATRQPACALRVRDALAAADRRDSAGHPKASMETEFPGRDLLTPRELEVLGQITGGASNKEAGRHLGISPRTIEVHRARIMEKLGARNAADLVRIVLTGEAD
eukprot:gene26733-29354_t